MNMVLDTLITEIRLKADEYGVIEHGTAANKRKAILRLGTMIAIWEKRVQENGGYEDIVCANQFFAILDAIYILENALLITHAEAERWRGYMSKASLTIGE